MGALWSVDAKAAVLRCVETWHEPTVQIPAFEAATRATAFAPGIGLPGRVWASGQSTWIPDVVQDANFPRAAVAAQEGLHGAFGFPIRLGREVVGIVEFFSRAIQEPDPDLLEMMTTIGVQIGHVFERQAASQALKEADRRKDEFLATLAHELRNPLAPIRNALELMRRAPQDADLTEEVRHIMERQLAQMVRLVDDLLDISRITSGKLQVRKQCVELSEVFKSAIEAARPLIDSQGHELTVALPPKPIHLDADPARLAQIVSNLLNNSAKYTEKGGHIWLTAQLENEKPGDRQTGIGAADNGDQAAAPAGPQLKISVRDTGVGISAEHLPVIFQMFSQPASALERSQGGLGIGLSLVRGLVELHGGKVEAHSAGPGLGSEFTVCLPIAERNEIPSSQHGQQAGEGDAEGQPVTAPTDRRLRILVVDDNRDAVESLALMLRMMGHETQTAHDGLEAIQAAAAFRPEVALLDIGLPKMNGYEAARHIREQPGGKQIVLVALTGWGQEEDKRRAAQAGFDHHLVKPTDLAALLPLLDVARRAVQAMAPDC
jgi:signal transduction histidine kinase/ActR/RegA family two-component response regulator